jgi:signal transduction histidine kinase/ActR/RegA family two-component response regulator
LARNHAIQRLRRAFILGLGFLALVVIAAQYVAMKVPADSATYVHIVNLASRQRMLCEQITKTALMIHDGSLVAETRARSELDQALGTFARTHHALRHGDPEQGLPGNNSLLVESRFAEIDRWFRDVVSSGEVLLAEPRASGDARLLLPVLLEADLRFDPLMEGIVAAYEQETAAQVKTFRNLETLILTLTFLSLGGIALGVIRPVIRSVENEMQRRLRAQAKLRDQADELREAAETAQAAVRAKARFLASMSHEMRTPLNGVVGMAQVLEETNLDQEQREGLEVIKNSSQALLALISDILDLAKIEAGHLEIEKVDFDLHELVGKAARIVEPVIGVKGVQLRTEIESGVPRYVLGDPTRIRQVLLNLLSNATKFTVEGSVTIRLWHRPAASAGCELIRFEVADTGIGISEEQKERIFQPFTQADDSTTRRFGGTGLGLAISGQLVERMGGRLGCDSQPGEGSIFHFELELAMGDGTKANQEPAARVAVAAGDEVRPLDILLVDDLPLNRLVARKMLQAMGHTVWEAEDGLEAVSAFQERKFDLILMDMEMPKLDGIGATALIRELEEEGSWTPVIALTANALAGDRERILAEGLDDYLAKPIQREKLVETLARFSAGISAPQGAGS